MSKNIILNFGKFNTKNIEEVDVKYLRWLYKTNKDKHLSPYMKEILDWIKEHIELDDEIILTFGKYKDKKLSDVPIDYLKWLYQSNENKELSSFVKKMMDDIKIILDKDEAKPKGRNWRDTYPEGAFDNMKLQSFYK